MKPKWSLLSILLLMAAVAAWTTYFRFHYETPKLLAKAERMAEFSGELFVKDEEQFAAIRSPQEWRNDYRWDVLLPAGHEYSLRLATRSITNDSTKFPSEYEEYRLPLQAAGRHRLQLIRKGEPDNTGYVIIKLDGEEVIRVDEKDWRPILKEEKSPTYAESGMHKVSTVTHQQTVKLPLDLYRVIFSVPAKTPGTWVTPNEPSSGILFWIERVDERLRPVAIE